MSKRPVVGIDTKRSARAVKGRVLAQVRGKEKEVKKKPLVIGASAVIGLIAILFVILQFEGAEQVGKKLATTTPDDRLLVEVHQLTEDNKQDYELEHDETLEKGVHYKLIKIEYYLKKKRGEQVIIDHEKSISKMYRNLVGLKLEREGSIVYEETRNTEDDFAELKYIILVKSDGLTEDVIRSELNYAKIKVELTQKNGYKTIDTFTLGQYAQFVGEDELSKILTTPSKAVVSTNDFLYQLEVANTQIQAGEPFELFASLTYTGDQDSITIVHAASPFYYDMTEITRDFELDYFMDQPAITTVLKKGETLKHQYQFTAGYSDQDSEEYRAFVDQFLAGDTPKGSYKVDGYVQFQIEGEDEQTELGGHIGFDVK